MQGLPRFSRCPRQEGHRYRPHPDPAALARAHLHCRREGGQGFVFGKAARREHRIAHGLGVEARAGEVPEEGVGGVENRGVGGVISN